MPRSLSVSALLFLSLAVARADITFLGIGILPGDSEDLSGLTGKYSDGMPQNRLGGLGSAIAYSGRGDVYILACDNGPKVSDPDFRCRIHKLEIVVKPGTKNPVTLKLTATTLLTDEKGKALVGNPARLDKKHPEKSLRFDPEGIRVGRDGTVFISDELGPYLYQFDSEGKRTKAFEVPIKFLPEHPSDKLVDELPPKNLRGRIPNRGLEGLAISPDGGKLFAMMQSPLLQDGELDDLHKPLGHFCRLLELDIATGATREFVYHLEDHGSSLCEIVAVNDSEFLVLERDNKMGKEALLKKVFRIDIDKATDVSKVEKLPSKKLPAEIVPVKKKLFLDLLDKKHNHPVSDIPDKIEGMTFGPDLPDGRHLLLVTTDNDFIAASPTRVFAFAIDKADLPGYKPQKFGK